jgi:formylglycine-generating enzyme required for sulfatase activity
MKAYKSFLFFMILTIIPLWAVQAQQKYALVIGNGTYTDVTRLNNPVNDANDMSSTLTGLGFNVDKVLNGNLEQMENAVARLKNRLSTDGGAYGFFFYTGHGVQSGGENYLIPADANIAGESFLMSRAMQVQAVLDALNQAGNALNIVVLDACRDNPFSWAQGDSRGLQAVSSHPADSIIVYAASSGQAVQDGTGRNGLFTKHLLKNLKTPGLEVQEVFRRTEADVSNASNQNQKPAIYTQFFGTAHLGRTAPVPRPNPTLAAPQNVQAGTPGTNSVAVSWDSAGSGIRYKVYYNTQNDPSHASALSNLAVGTSMNINGLRSGTAYYFWVTSLKDGLESGKSVVLAVQTAVVRPAERPISGDMVRIQGGTFTMGSPASEVDRQDWEGPQHQVTVSGFYMGKYEVTQAEYQAVMGTNPSSFTGDRLPVEYVSWFDAVNYCNERSRKEGLSAAYTVNGTDVSWNRNANGYRLPTEAEWEYACRAETNTPFNTGDNLTTSQANYDGNYPYNNNAKGILLNTTTTVGSFAPNDWGLYDMHGNVWEWCWDWYESYGSGAQADPVGAPSGTDRVFRGGSWINDAQFLRSANRLYITPSYRLNNLGFRLVRSER